MAAPVSVEWRCNSLIDDPDLFRRLATVRHFLARCASEADGPEFLSNYSILPLHDAVEMFLSLAVEQLGISVARRATLVELFDAVNESMVSRGHQPKNRAIIQRLSEARNKAKHSAVGTPGNEARGLSKSVARLVEELSMSVFSVDIKEVLATDCVAPDRARAAMRDAALAHREQNWESGILACKLAYESIIDDFTHRHGGKFGVIEERTIVVPTLPPDDPLHEFVGWIVDFADQCHRDLTALARGINPIDLSLFMRTIARAEAVNDEQLRAWTMTSGASREDLEFCMDFVLRVSISLSQLQLPYRTSRHPEAS